ncbi:unnamed protein product [Closterium sp. Naga37s-1]|nr:unnamed protein product [Closterium sp. Naga37s-1]
MMGMSLIKELAIHHLLFLPLPSALSSAPPLCPFPLPLPFALPTCPFSFPLPPAPPPALPLPPPLAPSPCPFPFAPPPCPSTCSPPPCTFPLPPTYLSSSSDPPPCSAPLPLNLRPFPLLLSLPEYPGAVKLVTGSFFVPRTLLSLNASGNYNLLVEAMLVDAAGGPPDSLAIVKGAVCDAAATDVLALPLAAADWQQRAGWWLLHAEARLDAFLENADAATLDALLAGGRRMGRELLMRAFGLAARQGGQKQGGQQQGGQQQKGGAQQAPAVSGYAVLAGSSAAGVT